MGISVILSTIHCHSKSNEHQPSPVLGNVPLSTMIWAISSKTTKLAGVIGQPLFSDWFDKGLLTLRLFSHDGKVRILNFNSKCAFWIKIRKTHFRPCVCQITSRNLSWNAHLKSCYRHVFQLRFSQITQRNLCMNDLTSKSCFGGRS